MKDVLEELLANTGDPSLTVPPARTPPPLSKRKRTEVSPADRRDGLAAKRRAAVSARPFCSSCKKIVKDLDKIFNSHTPASCGEGVPRRRIEPPSAASPCPLCRFFAQMRIDNEIPPDMPSVYEVSEDWYLRSFSARGLFGVSRDCQFPDTCFLAVVRGKWSRFERTDAFKAPIDKFILPTRWLNVDDEDRFLGHPLPPKVDFGLIRSRPDARKCL